MKRRKKKRKETKRKGNANKEKRWEEEISKKGRERIREGKRD